MSILCDYFLDRYHSGLCWKNRGGLVERNILTGFIRLMNPGECRGTTEREFQDRLITEDPYQGRIEVTFLFSLSLES